MNGAILQGFLKTLHAALLLEQPKLENFKLEYVAGFFWFDSAFLALPDVGFE